MDLREKARCAPEAARAGLVVGYVVSRLREVLLLEDDSAVHARSRFEELGVDSKQAVELKEELEQALGCALETTLLFDYPTPEALANYVVASVLFDNPPSD